ncbi:MAG: hypothetical protein HY648_12280 [Acidobacteria bacterium]|nr:hypothetical protein [Acidobacteriota bacterium]
MNLQEFEVSSVLDGKRYQCRFYNLMTGISLRHSDTVDVKFLVNGKGVVIALPHAAWAEHRQRSGRFLTDSDAIQIAGLFLKESLERGEPLGEPFFTPTVQQTLELATKIRS